MNQSSLTMNTLVTILKIDNAFLHTDNCKGIAGQIINISEEFLCLHVPIVHLHGIV